MPVDSVQQPDGACLQVYVVGAFRETLQVAASTDIHTLTANLTLASAAPIGFLAAIDMANGSANWTAQYAGWPSEVPLASLTASDRNLPRLGVCTPARGAAVDLSQAQLGWWQASLLA